MWSIGLASLFGFLGGIAGTRLAVPSGKTIYAEAVELSDGKGNVVRIGISNGRSALQLIDSKRRVRAELAAGDGGTSFTMTSGNGKFASGLTLSSRWPSFYMTENGSARLGFGLQADDTGSTLEQNWVFYTGAGGIDGARAVLGSGLPYGHTDKIIRGSVAVCCAKDGNLWTAPPK